MRKLFAILICSFAYFSSAAQSSPCATNPVYRQFDFWLGHWNVETRDGKPAGTSRIELMLDSCVLLENWENGNGTFSGKSFNVFNRNDKQWQQTWVDDKGGKTEYSGGLSNGSMVLTTKPQMKNADTTMVNRMTFTLQPDGSVRQHGEFSVNGGSTWSTQYDLYYKRQHSTPKN